MSQTAISTIEDHEAGIADMMKPATASTAIQMMAAMAEKRIATARMFPRKVSVFKAEAINLLREDVETARSAEYAKPVGGGTVRGPSIRLAELAAMCWGNLEVEVSDPVITDNSVVVRATAWDLQRNYRQEAVASTSIVNKRGQRYPLHMIETAAAATAQKAKRNAIIAVIPRAYINDLLEEARKVASGNELPLDKRRVQAIEFFARTYRVAADRIIAALGVAGIDDINAEHLSELQAMHTAIKEGSATIDEFFPAVAAGDSKVDALKQKLDERRKSVEPTKPTETNGATKPAEPQPDKPAPTPTSDSPAAKGATLRTLKSQIKELKLTDAQVIANMVHLGLRTAECSDSAEKTMLSLTEDQANRLIDELANPS